VPFGAFRRALAAAIGGYDETLLANEDYEFNARIREHGGKVWLDPQIRATYYARPTLATLARQYWRYGFWKIQMLRRNPATVRPRQIVAPAFVATLGALGVLLPFARLARTLLALVLTLYAGVLALAAAGAARKQRRAELLLSVPPAVATMHLAWGAGFLAGLMFPPARERR
jgi:GT2 family glycosyltransferase